MFSGDGVNKLRDFLNENETADGYPESDSYDGDVDNDREGQEVITGLFQNTALGGMEDFDE